MADDDNADLRARLSDEVAQGKPSDPFRGYLIEAAEAAGVDAATVLAEFDALFDRPPGDRFDIEHGSPFAPVFVRAVGLAEHERALDGATVVVSIGNTDNGLTQQEWSAFYREVDDLLRSVADVIHGAWVSPSTAPYQNAAWAFTGGSRWNRPWGGAGDTVKAYTKTSLSDLASRYGQDAIAWVEGQAEFVAPLGLPER